MCQSNALTFAGTHPLGRSGGSGNPSRDTEISPHARILLFLIGNCRKATCPALLWLLEKAAQVCLHLVLTRLSLGKGLGPPLANWAPWCGRCLWRKGLNFVAAGSLCPRNEEHLQPSAREPCHVTCVARLGLGLTLPLELLPVCLLPSTH